ncbi:MAG: AlpA family phage regulatory protein [Pseudomonadota bacterium]
MPETFLQDKQLAERWCVDRTSIWRWHRELEGFPRVVRLTPGCARWRLSDIEAWESKYSEELVVIED